VLRDISLTIGPGEALVVSGANGSGKSTLLRLICGLQRPSAGEIIFRHGDGAYAPGAAAHLIGWVAPDLALYRELSARVNGRLFGGGGGL
jgi:heme exporter protein A